MVSLIREDLPELVYDYERALLGACLNGHGDIPAITRTITAGDYADPRHSIIWDAIVALHAAGTAIHPMTVKDQLGLNAKLAGGPLYLTDLIGEPWTDPHWSANKIRESRIRRDIAALGTRCHQLIEDTDATPEELIAKIRTWADQITTSTEESTDIRAALEQVIDIAQHGEPAGIPTPWASLNELLDGMHPGQLITFAARPGVGKSIALENVATHTARTGVWVHMVSLEMSPKEITQRTMAHTARVELSKLRRGQGALSSSEWAAVEQASTVIADTRIRFADQSAHTIATIRAGAWDTAQHAKRHGERLGMVVIDYCQLITQARGSKAQTRQQIIGEFMRGLKRLAHELGVPVVTAAQVGRSAANRTNGVPVLADLREAGDIEQDSDVVVFLHEQVVEDSGRTITTGDLDLIVAKNRNGPQGTRTVRKAGHYSRIYDQEQA